jgi:hypothetical protein
MRFEQTASYRKQDEGGMRECCAAIGWGCDSALNLSGPVAPPTLRNPRADWQGWHGRGVPCQRPAADRDVAIKVSVERFNERFNERFGVLALV